MKTNTMKKLASLLGCALVALFGKADEVLDQFLAECRAPAGSEVELGVWNGDLDACKKVADENGIPMVAIWSNSGCAHCKVMERALLSETFREWAKTCGLVLHFSCSEDPRGQRKGTYQTGIPVTEIGTGTGAYKWFCKRPNNIGNYPHVRFYWYQNGTKVVDYSVLGDTVDNQTSKDSGSNPATYNKAGQVVINYILQKSGFGAYTPKPLVKYAGGSFAAESTPANRLEAEAGTGEISFEMVRDEKVKELATNNTVKVVGPDGKTVQEIAVEWAANESNKTVTVDISGAAFAKDGDQVLLIAVDADGSEQATNTVTYVSGSGENVANPLWFGERSAPKAAEQGQSQSKPKTLAAASGEDAPELQFGEWTMDLDVAKAKVAATEGNAYTLVAIEGSLWCHDCANAERNFMSVSDNEGNNKFIAWAKAKNVALVAIDIPNGDASPTLLSRKGYATTLAYELPSYGMYDVSLGGAEPSLTNAMVRSGLGYLTRKGVSDEDAAQRLAENLALVAKDLSEGGFHSPVDSRDYRTGVPIYVLLDKDGNPAARMTRFQNVSPYAADRAKWDDIIKRFDEMLAIADGAHADGGVWQNDYPSDAIAGFKANGGGTEGEISHVDAQDILKLEDFTGNAFLKTTVSGESSAEVTVSYLTLDAEGKPKTVGTPVTGRLSDGIALEHEFEASGTYFLKIAGDVAGDDFGVANANADNFHAYSVAGTVVFVPQEDQASGKPASGSDKVTMRLEEGQMYRIEGLNTSMVGDVLRPSNETDPYCLFYTALESGDKDLTTTKKDVTVTYQKWTPGKIGFVAEKKTVAESADTVKVSLARTDGKSGKVTVKVSLDEEATTLYDSDGTARFEFADVEMTFADGVSGETNVTVKVLDDKRFDGTGDVALKLAIVSDENGDTVLTTTNYVLTVTEDDKQSAGKAVFVAAEPFFSKKATVYARESEGATIYAERIEASDGYVTVKLNATNGAKTEVGGVETNVIAWANHKAAPQAVKVTGIAAGKSAKISLAGPTDGLKLLTASNAVTVVSVADDAPAFEQDADSKVLYRYVAASNLYPVVFAEGVDASAATLTFTKLSGTLPAGLTAKYDAAAKALAISGTPTKAGDFTMVYQVSQKIGGKTTPGLTIELSYSIGDPTVAGGEVFPYNEAVAAGKSRTFKDLPVIDKAAKRLAGVVQVTIPQTGKASAKYTCRAGAVSFSAKGWSNFADEGDKALKASLTSSKQGYAMELVAHNDGSVDILIVTPETGGGEALVASCEGGVWSKTDNASTWQGYYTVALMNNGVVEAEGAEGLAPRGNGYLTLKMNTSSAVNSGTVTWAGLLPNGTAVSGSTVLCHDDECDGVARLAVFKSSSTDVLAALVGLCDGGRVLGDDDADTYWSHVEKYEATSYDVKLNTYGNLYSATTNLAEACMVGYDTMTPTLTFDIAGLGGWLSVGTPVSVGGVTVTVSEKTLTPTKGNPIGATLSFNRSTGVVTGSFKLPYTTAAGAEKTVSASYKGVVLIDFGPGCGCGDDDPERPVILPFVTGAFYLTDKVSVQDGKTVSVKRGGAVAVDTAE